MPQFIASLYGWISGAWQKNPLLFGYSGDQTEQVSNLNADAGTNILSGTTVPAGEVWVIQIAYALNATNSVAAIEMVALVNSIAVAMVQASTTAANIWVTWSGEVVLSEGDQIKTWFYGCTAGDDLYLRYHGYKMDIDQ